MFGPHWDDNQTSRQDTLGGLRYDGDIGQFLADKAKLGIIPRSIELIFTELEALSARNQDQGSGFDDGFTVYCSFLQIYNEKLFDLL